MPGKLLSKADNFSFEANSKTHLGAPLSSFAYSPKDAPITGKSPRFQKEGKDFPADEGPQLNSPSSSHHNDGDMLDRFERSYQTKPSLFSVSILCNCFLTISLMQSIALRFTEPKHQF